MEMFVGGGLDYTRGLDQIDMSGIDLATMTAVKTPAIVQEDILVGMTFASLEEYLIKRNEVAEFTSDDRSTGVRSWLRRLLSR